MTTDSKDPQLALLERRYDRAGFAAFGWICAIGVVIVILAVIARRYGTGEIIGDLNLLEISLFVILVLGPYGLIVWFVRRAAPTDGDDFDEWHRFYDLAGGLQFIVLVLFAVLILLPAGSAMLAAARSSLLGLATAGTLLACLTTLRTTFHQATRQQHRLEIPLKWLVR